MPKLGIYGATGKMGQAIARLAAPNASWQVTAQIGREEATSFDVRAADVWIDFSSPEALTPLLQQAVEYRLPLVVGTTGLTADHQKAMQEAGKTIPIFYAPNTSLGIYLLAKAAADVAKALGPGVDCEIYEAHHRAKKDAPSGTALLLGEKIATARGQDLKTVMCNRMQSPERKEGSIGFSVSRLGEVAGEHIIRFGWGAEVLELRHTAFSRDTFANGALLAAEWLLKQKPGFYSMQDILG